jgi:hypothetical protein
VLSAALREGVDVSQDVRVLSALRRRLVDIDDSNSHTLQVNGAAVALAEQLGALPFEEDLVSMARDRRYGDTRQDAAEVLLEAWGIGRGSAEPHEAVVAHFLSAQP